MIATVDDLRAQLASAMCAAQTALTPRTVFVRMLKSLLHHAFEGLDEDSGVDRGVAVRLACHALASWQEAASARLVAFGELVA